MAEIASKKVETIVLEWINQRDSGYRRDDMKGSPLEGRITCGSQCGIPNTGKMAKTITETDKNGKPVEKIVFVPIRYIKGCDEIEIAEQKKRGYEPNAIKTEDKIYLNKGTAVVKDEGDRAFFKYISNVFYNEDAPNRSKRAVALFRIAKKAEKVSADNEVDFARGRALGYVEGLTSKKGKEFSYDETRIDSTLSILSKFGGETPDEKIKVLVHEAKNNPVEFLKLVTKLDDLIVTQITHALELDVIHFSGNSAEYVDDKKILAQLGDGKMKQSAKITKLSEMLRLPEYEGQYNEFKIKLEIAQENSLKN